jgi:hypothetical protein
MYFSIFADSTRKQNKKSEKYYISNEFIPAFAMSATVHCGAENVWIWIVSNIG